MTPSLWLTFLMAWPGPGGGIVGKWGKHSPLLFLFSVSLRRKISATHNDSNFWETSPVSLMCIWQSVVCITTSSGNLRDAGCTDASYISHDDATHCSDISPMNQMNHDVGGQRREERIMLYFRLAIVQNWHILPKRKQEIKKYYAVLGLSVVCHEKCVQTLRKKVSELGK